MLYSLRYFLTGTKWEKRSYLHRLQDAGPLGGADLTAITFNILYLYRAGPRWLDIQIYRQKQKEGNSDCLVSEHPNIPRYQVLRDSLQYWGEQRRFSLKARGLYHAAGPNAGPSQQLWETLAPGLSDLKTGHSKDVNKGAETAVLIGWYSRLTCNRVGVPSPSKEHTQRGKDTAVN